MSLKFFSKFDVRMSYHQSNAFSKIFHILFIIGSTFLIYIPEYLKIYGGVSCHHSQHLKTKEEFSSKSYPFSQRFVVLAWCHPLIIVFDCENSFHPSGAMQESFQFDSSKGHHFGIIHSSFWLSFSKSYRCIVQIFSNQFMISSFSCI